MKWHWLGKVICPRRSEAPAKMLDALQIVDQQKIFYDPNISQPPDFQAKNLSLICRLIRKYLYWIGMMQS